MLNNTLDTEVSSGLVYDMHYRPVDGQTTKPAQCLGLNGTEIVFLADEIFVLGRALEIKVSSGPRGPHLMTAFVEVHKVQPERPTISKITAAIRTIKG